ncbi:hypothetical protein ES703_50463 [subsurface metagenome]
MKKEINREKISQRSVGLKSRQWEFLSANPDINLDEFVRQKLEEEIIKRAQFKFLAYKKIEE